MAVISNSKPVLNWPRWIIPFFKTMSCHVIAQMLPPSVELILVPRILPWNWKGFSFTLFKVKVNNWIGLLTFSIWLIEQLNGTGLALFLAIGKCNWSWTAWIKDLRTSHSNSISPRGGGLGVNCIPNFAMAACTALCGDFKLELLHVLQSLDF